MLRFSLRTLMVAMLAAACFLGGRKSRDGELRKMASEQRTQEALLWLLQHDQAIDHWSTVAAVKPHSFYVCGNTPAPSQRLVQGTITKVTPDFQLRIEPDKNSRLEVGMILLVCRGDEVLGTAIVQADGSTHAIAWPLLLTRVAPGDVVRTPDWLLPIPLERPVDGIVIAVGGRNLAEISIGSDDGVCEGQVLEVTRGSSRLGRVTVRKLTANRAVVEWDRNIVVRKGDRVHSLLEE